MNRKGKNKYDDRINYSLSPPLSVSLFDFRLSLTYSLYLPLPSLTLLFTFSVHLSHGFTLSLFDLLLSLSLSPPSLHSLTSISLSLSLRPSSLSSQTLSQKVQSHFLRFHSTYLFMLPYGPSHSHTHTLPNSHSCLELTLSLSLYFVFLSPVFSRRL